MALEASTAYLVESAEDPTVMIAIDAKLHDDLVEWFDTVRDRAFEVTRVHDEPDGLSVETERATYRLRKLTRALYEAHVMDHVIGHPTFASSEAIQAFYRSFPR